MQGKWPAPKNRTGSALPLDNSNCVYKNSDITIRWYFIWRKAQKNESRVNNYNKYFRKEERIVELKLSVPWVKGDILGLDASIQVDM